MIEFDQVSIDQRGGRRVLDSVSLRVADGDLCVVLGRTGSGKSTLLGAINGLVPHHTGATLRGQVRVGGRSTAAHQPRDLADLVGYVPQDPQRGFVTDTVEDELAYGMEQLGIDPAAMRTRVEDTLDLLGIADLRRRSLATLSGGQAQRVSIASVLAAQPRILVLDEPTSALDPTAAQDVLASITTLVHEVGLTVVLAEHRLERVLHAADQALWLPGDGRVVAGEPRQVLGRADVHPPLHDLATALRWDSIPLTVREARRHVSADGPEAIQVRPVREEAPRDAVVNVRNLSVHRGDRVAVNQVSLSFTAGEVTAVMGRNGAGKSSLLWALHGALNSTGELTIDGRDPRRLGAAEVRQLISLVPQTASDLLYLPTVAQECAQADQESGAAPGSTAAVVTRLGFELDPEAHPRDLSEGQRLGLVLAIQLVRPEQTSGPTVICLDEPTRGLDYTGKRHLAELVTALAAEGAAVLISTHDVEFAANATTRAVVLADGDVVAEGPTRQVCTASPTFAPQVAKVFHPRPVLTTADLVVETTP